MRNARFYGTHRLQFEPAPKPWNLGFAIVPEQYAYVVERLGKYSRTMYGGFHLMIPVFENVAYIHSLKEQSLEMEQQTAITRDNVTIAMDGVLYVRIIDPVKASYGVSNCLMAISQLAQTTMRSEIGKMTLDKTFEERELLNDALVQAINTAAEPWGAECLRYEIRDIIPPDTVRDSMDQQAEAVRKKRANISESEGVLQADINIAQGAKRALELKAEGESAAIKMKAEGEAAAIRMKAEATAEAIRRVSEALEEDEAEKALSLRVAEQYVDAFGKLAKESTTLMLPSNANDPSAFVAQALGIYSKVVDKQKKSSKED